MKSSICFDWVSKCGTPLKSNWMKWDPVSYFDKLGHGSVKSVWFSYLFQKMWRRKKLGHLILEVVSVFAWLPPKRGNATEEPMGAAPKQIDWASLIRGQRGSVGRDIFGRNSRGKEMYGRKKLKEECEANILRLIAIRFRGHDKIWRKPSKAKLLTTSRLTWRMVDDTFGCSKSEGEREKGGDKGGKEKSGHKEDGLTSRSFRGTGLRLCRATGLTWGKLRRQ